MDLADKTFAAWPLKVIITLFIYFNHQIKSITSLDCNMSSKLCPHVTTVYVLTWYVETKLLSMYYEMRNAKSETI